MKQKMIHLMDEIAEEQRNRLLALARRYVPQATPEDILQPNDFPQLENHPLFRYEEGVLEGILTLRMALLALMREEG